MSNLVLQYLADNPRLYTEVGSKQRNLILLDRCVAGCGFYGPYASKFVVLSMFAVAARRRSLSLHRSTLAN
jgi:hypothetical protein